MPNLFRLLNELIILLLGALLIVLAISGHVGLPGRPAALVVIGIVLVYWGIRAWTQPARPSDRLQSRIRAGSLVLVGILILGIRFLPLHNAEILLGIAGGVLALRGFVGGALSLRRV